MIEAPEVLRFYDDELSKMLEFMTRGGNNKYVRADRIEELSNCVAVLEDKLAKAVEALEWCATVHDSSRARTTLAELKGQDDE